MCHLLCGRMRGTFGNSIPYIPIYFTFNQHLTKGHEYGNWWARTSFYRRGEVIEQLERIGKMVAFQFFSHNKYLVYHNKYNRHMHLFGILMHGVWTGTASLCQSHPWPLAILPNGHVLGFLANTTKCYHVLKTPNLCHFFHSKNAFLFIDFF